MSSTSSNTYAYQSGSTMATRSLVSDNNTTNSSNDVGKPTPQRNYEQAAAAATKADQVPATTAGSAAASVTDRTGAMRQQSWQMSDLKGQKQEQMVSGKAAGPGYSSTQK